MKYSIKATVEVRLPAFEVEANSQEEACLLAERHIHNLGPNLSKQELEFDGYLVAFQVEDTKDLQRINSRWYRVEGAGKFILEG